MPRNTITVNDHVAVNTREMRNFGRALRAASPMLNRQFRARMRAAGAIVRDKAKVNASEHSESIPPTIRLTGTGTNLYVLAGNQNVPLAALYELGNAPNRRSPSGPLTFRHPIFGVWVTGKGDQTGYPFLARALDETIDKVEALIMEALDAAVHEIVWGYR